MVLSAVCISIPDPLHGGGALTGHSSRQGNTLIVSCTSAIYATPSAAAAFITASAPGDNGGKHVCVMSGGGKSTV